MAKPNYKFEKRQKDLAKQKKKEEKKLKKLERKDDETGESTAVTEDAETAVDTDTDAAL